MFPLLGDEVSIHLEFCVGDWSLLPSPFLFSLVILQVYNPVLPYLFKIVQLLKAPSAAPYILWHTPSMCVCVFMYCVFFVLKDFLTSWHSNAPHAHLVYVLFQSQNQLSLPGSLCWWTVLETKSGDHMCSLLCAITVQAPVYLPGCIHIFISISTCNLLHLS